MRLIIVKRGALSTFRLLEQSCKDIAGLRVVWDRRRRPAAPHERSLAAQRPALERRGEAPHSWTAADHVFVDVDVEAGAPAPVARDDVNDEGRL
jgi:hypothetical protein